MANAHTGTTRKSTEMDPGALEKFFLTQAYMPVYTGGMVYTGYIPVYTVGHFSMPGILPAIRVK